MRSLLALLLVLTLAGPARAAPDEVQPPGLQVLAGLTGDETVRTGWTPFEVVLSAAGTPLELVVELALGESSQQLVAGLGWRCERTVTLAPGQRRRLWFVAPVRARRWGGLTYRVVVRTAGEAPRDLVAAGPRTLTVEPRTRMYYNYSQVEARTAVLVVSDSSEPRDVDWLSRERRRDHAGPARVGLRSPASLPEAVAAYDAVDLVVVRDADLSALRPAQAEALVAWVEDGGRVLLVPPHDPAWFGERTVARLVEGRRARVEDGVTLPTLTAPDGTRHPAPQVSTLVLERTAVVDLDAGLRLRRQRGVDPGVSSWLQGFPRGRGEVWVLAADVGREPFLRWPGADILGSAVTATTTPRPSGAAREPEETVDAMQAVSVRDAPARWLVVGLVLVYVVVVGPLNDRLLRRKGALLLLVATIPAVALLWTLLVFSVGWATKGLSTVSRRLTLLSVRQGETLARERTLLGLRAASAAEYDVAFGPGLESYQLERPYEQQTASRDQVAFDEAQGHRHRVSLRLWSQAAFDAEGLRRLRGPLRVTQAAGVTTLENGSELALDAVVAVGREGTLVGGPAPAGGRVVLAAAAEDPTLTEGVAEQRRLLGRHDGSGALVELALRLGAHPQDAQAVSSLLQGLGVTPGGSGPPIVVARLAAPPSLATVDGRARADRELLLIVAHPPRPEAE
jgi:hypothetical protein